MLRYDGIICVKQNMVLSDEQTSKRRTSFSRKVIERTLALFYSITDVGGTPFVLRALNAARMIGTGIEEGRYTDCVDETLMKLLA